MRSLIALLCFLPACGAANIAITDSGSHVRVISAQRADSCDYVTTVSSTQGANFHDIDHNIEIAMNDLRNKAAKAGADAVVVDQASERDAGKWGSLGECNNCVRMTGHAYHCGDQGSARALPE